LNNQLNNQAAIAALAATQSTTNKLNVQQLQQLSRFSSGLGNYPHLMSSNFASSLGHLSAHHQFLASLNGASSLFPSLANLTQNSALSAALKSDPSFRLHHSLAQFASAANLPTQANSTADASLMQHLINSTSSANSLVNGQQQSQLSNSNSNNKSSNVNNNKLNKQSINENGKRLNVEDLDDDCEEYDTSMNEDDDCDDKCSINSSTNGQTKGNKLTNGTSGNGDNSSPLSALYELANKDFVMTRTDKSAEGNVERLNNPMFSNNGQNAKKKRKSRTAFTNKQIFELEKKFIYQKYLTPADRDDLAEKLDLSGAQVITWFQNRRAKQKRDHEELSKDMQTTKLFQVAQMNPFLYNKALIENSLPHFYENMPNMNLYTKPVIGNKTSP